MKVFHFSSSSSEGGAARAATRIHSALLESGLDSSLFVDRLTVRGDRVFGSEQLTEKFVSKFRVRVAKFIMKGLSTRNTDAHSLAIFSSKWLDFINKSEADIIHLHWINREMMSISDIGKINKPVIWTLHDMWPFSGAEHLCDDDRWKVGYTKNNRPKYEKGLDLNRWVFERKLKYWKSPISIVTPSDWLSKCAETSYIMKSWPVSTIPNCIDISIWKPETKTAARKKFHLPIEKPLLLFGSYGSNSSKNKGSDLLQETLSELSNHSMDFELVVFGESSEEQFSGLDLPVHFTGHIDNDLTLASLYSAADALVVPSRIEAFGQVAAEAQACGTPVIAFSTSGLRDIVNHRTTGYLAEPFKPSDLAKGIKWVLEEADRSKVGAKAHLAAHDKFSYKTVSARYISLYEEILGGQRQKAHEN